MIFDNPALPPLAQFFHGFAQPRRYRRFGVLSLGLHESWEVRFRDKLTACNQGLQVACFSHTSDIRTQLLDCIQICDFRCWPHEMDANLWPFDGIVATIGGLFPFPKAKFSSQGSLLVLKQLRTQKALHHADTFTITQNNTQATLETNFLEPPSNCTSNQKGCCLRVS